MRERWTPAYDRLFDPNHELAGDPVCRRFAWLDLCHMAQYEDKTRVVKGEVVPLKRGEFVASLRFLGERWGWDKNKVSRFLKLLQHESVTKIRTVRETPGGTVYRVVSYDTYANPGDSNGTAGGTQKGTTAGQRRDSGGTKNSSNTSSTTESDAPAKGSRKAPLPDEWEPHEKHREKAEKLDLHLEAEAQAFRDHHLAHGKRMADWDRAFYTWLRNAPDFGPAKPEGSAGSEFREDSRVLSEEEFEEIYGTGANP